MSSSGAQHVCLCAEVENLSRLNDKSLVTFSRAGIAGAVEPAVQFGTEFCLSLLCACRIVKVVHLPGVGGEIVVLHEIDIGEIDLQGIGGREAKKSSNVKYE